MADFVAIAYDDMFKAQEVRLRLLKLQQEYLICMEDAVVAVKIYAIWLHDFSGRPETWHD